MSPDVRSSAADCSSRRGAAQRAAIAMVAVGLSAMCLLWIVGTPPSAGPDEPSHITRGAALVRGQFVGDDPTDGYGQVSYQLPGWIGEPSPACYMFQPTVPAACAADSVPPDGVVTVNSRSAGYQFWPFVLPGIGTLFPESFGPYPARALDSLVPLLLLGWSLLVAVRRGWFGLAGALLAITPMAWFSVATVNPSGLAVAGGVAMWVGQDAVRRDPVAAHRWLVAAGWAALAVSRRDGLIWAGLILVITCLASGDGFRDWWHRMRLGPQCLVGLSTLATLIWAARQDDSTSRLLLLAPLIPLAAAVLRRLLTAFRHGSTVRSRRAAGGLVVGGAVLVLASLAVVVDDRNRFITEMSATGQHLTEAIGLLGWLDTPIPTVALYAWLVALGMLAASGLGVSWRPFVVSCSTLALGVTAAWMFEYLRNDPIGTWQGRYYLPLLAGVPIVLSQIEVTAASRRVGQTVTAAALLVSLAAFASALRRWGVGIDGPTAPWAWDTYGAPIAPAVLLGCFVATSTVVWVGVARLVGPADQTATDADGALSERGS